MGRALCLSIPCPAACVNTRGNTHKFVNDLDNIDEEPWEEVTSVEVLERVREGCVSKPDQEDTYFKMGEVMEDTKLVGKEGDEDAIPNKDVETSDKSSGIFEGTEQEELAMDGAINEAFSEVFGEETAPADPMDMPEVTVDVEPQLESRRKSTLTGSVESLLEKSGLGEHVEKFESNGYDSMQTLSLASKEDLMESGLKRGHASLVVHLTAGRKLRLETGNAEE